MFRSILTDADEGTVRRRSVCCRYLDPDLQGRLDKLLPRSSLPLPVPFIHLRSPSPFCVPSVSLPNSPLSTTTLTLASRTTLSIQAPYFPFSMLSLHSTLAFLCRHHAAALLGTSTLGYRCRWRVRFNPPLLEAATIFRRRHYITPCSSPLVVLPYTHTNGGY